MKLQLVLNWNLWVFGVGFFVDPEKEEDELFISFGPLSLTLILVLT